MAAKTPEYNLKNISGKNRIINGCMRADQRAPGSLYTLTNGVYNLDRWAGQRSNAGAMTVQRVTSSVPTGFTHAMKFTVTTADASVAAGDYDGFHQYIEGYNCADFDFGKTTAKDLTLSFWVRSSKTGVFSGSIMNSASDRSRTFEYTINSADTWEYKTILLVGDQVGTWPINNGLGLRLFFSFMVGTNQQQAPGSWGVSGNALGTANQVNLLDTIGATYYITGVQLEIGNTASQFEFKTFEKLIQECQRYFEKSYDWHTAVGSSTFNGGFTCTWVSANRPKTDVQFKVEKRTTPSITIYNPNSGATGQLRTEVGPTDIAAGVDGADIGTTGFRVYQATALSTYANGAYGHFVADCEI